MRGYRLLFSVALLAGCAATPDTPSTGGAPAPTPAAKAQLAPGGTLRVAVFTGNPVIGSKDPAGGAPRGTTALLGRALAAQAGLPVQVIDYSAVAKMVEDAKTGAWDVAVVAFDRARLPVLDFARPHLVVDLTYLVAPGSSIRNVSQIDQSGVNVAAARGAATTLLLMRTLKEARVVAADSEPAAFALLQSGKAQAYAQNRYMLLGLAESLPGARVLEERFASADLCFVLPKGRTLALEYVDAFVERAKVAGLVARSVEQSGLRGVGVAPLAR
jgi:polar amino acid transport system substrate-binding protein